MKRLFFFLVVVTLTVFAGCFETTEEVNLNDDGSGTYSLTNDMGNLIGMARQFGGDKMDKVKNAVKDTVLSLAAIADSVTSLTPAEKELVKNGTLGIKLNMQEDMFVLKMNFPFKNAADISKLRELSQKMLSETMQKQMASGDIGIGEELNMGGSNSEGGAVPRQIDDYYTVEYTNGTISKKVNKEMYAKLASDESMTQLKEMSSMGAPITMNYVINLPKPAKKAKGKKVKLSDDKKQVILKATSEDFFDDPSALEYTIEY
ncbi:MAG: hypothetical protein C4308_07530 [Chitinophagaceae bacterium]